MNQKKIPTKTVTTAGSLDKSIATLLDGTLMRKINQCPEVAPLKPENIHVVTLASPKYFWKSESYGLSLQTVKFYCSLHGYQYHIVNPIDVMRVHGTIKSESSGTEVINAKSLVMLCE